MDVNIQQENIQSGWQSVFSKHQHAVLLGHSSSATHGYLLGHIFTLYPSPHCDPVRSHLLMFITVSHLPLVVVWRFFFFFFFFGEGRGGTCALLLLQSRLEGRRLFHPYSDYESVTRHKRNKNSWWLLCVQTPSQASWVFSFFLFFLFFFLLLLGRIRSPWVSEVS